MDILYNKLQYHNVISSSVFSEVNAFLQAIIKERNRFPSVTGQQKEIPLIKKWKMKLQYLVSAKGIHDII